MKSSAIFLAWDDWGGFYDHLAPPTIDQNGYGLRVPVITISPYAKRGFIDHATLSSDADLKFIEDDFLGGGRLNPKTDGRPILALTCGRTPKSSATWPTSSISTKHPVDRSYSHESSV